MIAARLLLLAVALASSGARVRPNRVPGAVALDPTAYLRAEHDSAEACTGRHRAFARIVWLQVPGSSFRDLKKGSPNRGYIVGLWVWPDTIYVSAAWLTSWVPRHEMIHDLLRHGHRPGDSAVFGTACHATWGYLR